MSLCNILQKKCLGIKLSWPSSGTLMSEKVETVKRTAKVSLPRNFHKNPPVLLRLCQALIRINYYDKGGKLIYSWLRVLIVIAYLTRSIILVQKRGKGPSERRGNLLRLGQLNPSWWILTLHCTNGNFPNYYGPSHKSLFNESIMETISIITEKNNHKWKTLGHKCRHIQLINYSLLSVKVPWFPLLNSLF